MDFNTLVTALVTFIFFISLLFLFKLKIAVAGKLPPKAAGSRLFTGHIHVLSGGDSGRELPHIKLGSMADDHGSLFSINLGPRRAVVVSSFELAKELFTVHDMKISTRPGTRAIEILSHDYTMLGFAPYGSYWRQLRKLAIVELLSNRRVEMMRPVRESETKEAVKELYNLSSDGTELDMKKWFEDLSLNMTLMVVAKIKSDAVEKLQLIETVKEFFRLAGLFVAADAWPVLRWLDLGGYEKRMKETSKRMEKIIGGWLVEAERRRKESSGEDKPPSFMDVLLSVIPTAELETNKDADSIIRATCENMILGGVDTTSLTLTWALSLLLNHPTKLQEAQKELDEKIGLNRLVTESDLTDLVYLNAIVKETLRLYPVAPLSSTREFSEDCIVGGFNIRKGTWLILNLWKLQRDPRAWLNESEFKPERFLDEKKKVDVRGHDFELIPFGAGRRMCPGMTMGLQVVHMVLATLLHAFDIKTADNQLVDMSESIGLTNTKTTPINVIVKPRLAPDVYTA